jgi:hypothetical protein
MQMAPAVALTLLTENPAPLLWASALGTEAESYANLRSQGANTGGASWRALANGALAYGMGKLPVGTFFKSLDQGSTVALLAKVAGANATAAQVQTFVQDAIDMSVAHPDMTWSDFLKQRPGRAYDTLVSSIFQSAVLAGLGRATLGRGGSGKQPGEGDDLTDPRSLTSNLRAAMDLARRSKLAGRDPGAFQNSVQQIADTHGIGTVHITSGRLMQALTTSGVDGAAVLRRMPATLAQLRDMPAQGGDLAIPTGELIAGISGSGAEEAILPHLRRVPEALSLDQLRAVAADKGTVGNAATGASQTRQTPLSPQMATGTASPNGIEAPAVQPFPNTTDQASSSGGQDISAPPATATPATPATNDTATSAQRSLLGGASRQDGRVGEAAATSTHEVTLAPADIRFSQTTVSYHKKDRVTGEPFTYDDIVRSMKASGWVGAPVDAVEMPDGKLTSMDNTRIRAALEAGASVRMVLHKADDALSSVERERFADRKKGATPKTWGDAMGIRLAKQGKGFLRDYPHGTFEIPRLTGKSE